MEHKFLIYTKSCIFAKLLVVYTFIRNILFLFDAEQVHHFSLAFLSYLIKIPFAKSILKKVYCIQDPKLHRTRCGLHFQNPLGLAAGFDKNAAYIPVMECLGFGFVEIGTVTPLPQPGNDKPRLFRLPKDKAIINRMGFNNDGADIVAERLRKLGKRNIIVGGNIGKNKWTSNEDAVKDYRICFEKLFDVVDYFVVNVSSPNTPGLRALQDKDSLLQILFCLQEFNQQQNKSKPIFLKIAPDLTNEQVAEIVEIVEATKIQGIIATNTTISRDVLTTPNDIVLSIGAGGLSGAPVREASNKIIHEIVRNQKLAFDVIGVGGIMNETNALEKMNLGCSLIQVYTGFIYEGPGLNKRICNAILKNSTS